MIICQRSFPHLRAVFEEYEKLSKKTMVDAIKSEFSGDIKDGFVTVSKYDLHVVFHLFETLTCTMYLLVPCTSLI